ncbi:MAG: SpoIIE family protein phosphatase [Victivallaceae bacterium]
MILLIIFLAAAVAAAVALLLRERQRSSELSIELQSAREGNCNIDHFLTGMFHEMRGEGGMAGAMHVAARYLAEQCFADSAAIYELVDDRLIAVGMHGPYPLIHSGNRILLSRKDQLFDTLRRERITLGNGFIGEIARASYPELIPNGSMDPRFDEYPDTNVCGSVMAMGLSSNGTVVGACCVFGNRLHSGVAFNDEQFANFQLLAPQMAMALDLVHSYGEISRRERIDQELEFARQLQFSLLPAAFPDWDQFAVTAFTRSAKEVNGDFYDFVQIDENRLMVVLGDAAGKGVPACMLSAMTRSMIRALASNFVTLEDFLRELNSKMLRDTDADRFITLGCCLLDRKNSILEFGRAGHTELVTFVRDHIRTIMPQGSALGMMPDDLAEFDTFSTAFEPGMALLLFSDGLTEAIDADGKEFGLPRLEELFRQGCRSGESARGIINLILEEVGSYEAEQSDDQTIVLIQHI